MLGPPFVCKFWDAKDRLHNEENKQILAHFAPALTKKAPQN